LNDFPPTGFTRKNGLDILYKPFKFSTMALPFCQFSYLFLFLGAGFKPAPTKGSDRNGTKKKGKRMMGGVLFGQQAKAGTENQTAR
jgi:hypothetical protein